MSKTEQDIKITKLAAENQSLRAALKESCLNCQKINGYPKGCGGPKDIGSMNCHLCATHVALDNEEMI